MKLNPEFFCEWVDEDLLIVDSRNSSAFVLRGESATAMQRAIAGEILTKFDPGVQDLLDSKILLDGFRESLSRRSLVLGGAAVTTGGILALALPSSAHASSARITSQTVGLSTYGGQSGRYRLLVRLSLLPDGLSGVSEGTLTIDGVEATYQGINDSFWSMTYPDAPEAYVWLIDLPSDPFGAGLLVAGNFDITINWEYDDD